ncbi:phosphomannomutase [Candidatus Woesearchaeota archaeon CG10_big_fil_rev_8_21_14_0_10_36_11]|nr:MAG: phosphomannomutase [Candidatus Woesearchaeota archaeon CG10_big_fil_rev_8_21_14_0_10_36_11]
MYQDNSFDGRTLVIISGYFNPTHIGHVRLIEDAKKLGDKLIVIVNNDIQQIRKKGKIIMSEDERVEVVKAMKYVDEVFLSIDEESPVINSLEHIARLHRHWNKIIFANGGDRESKKVVPETPLCERYNIEMRFDVGGTEKLNSSTNINRLRGAEDSGSKKIKINPFIFRNYDIRGIVGKDLDEEKVHAIGNAYGTFLRRRKIRHAVVGRDCRLSSDMFRDSLIKGMTEMGINIIDIGMVMTQMMYYAQYRFQTNGGAMITASHNPYNYNGFKLGIGYSLTTGPEEVKEIRTIIENGDYFKSEKIGTVEQQDVTEDYYHDILKKITLNKKFKVIVDSGCGTTGLFIPELLRRAGCDVIERNTTVDGKFPVGTPDPTAESTMKRVRDAVLENNADIGFAFDGDGDRIGTVDEKGRVLWNDVLVAIFAKEILERFPHSKIVYNGLCSQVVREVIHQNNGIPVMWRTGHSFIKSKIAEENAVFGGELSGHFFFADNAYGHDDGAYAVVRVLEYLSERNVSLSQLYESFPVYISSPEIKIGCPDEKKEAIIKDIAEKFKADFPGNTVTDDSVIPGDDGTRIDFTDGMVIFRYSQNGPYITIKFEAQNQETYNQRKKYVKDTLLRYPDMVWQDDLCVNVESLD